MYSIYLAPLGLALAYPALGAEFGSIRQDTDDRSPVAYRPSMGSLSSDMIVSSLVGRRSPHRGKDGLLDIFFNDCMRGIWSQLKRAVSAARTPGFSWY